MHLQDDLNLHILCMFEGTFLFDTAHVTPLFTGDKKKQDTRTSSYTMLRACSSFSTNQTERTNFSNRLFKKKKKKKQDKIT